MTTTIPTDIRRLRRLGAVITGLEITLHVVGIAALGLVAIAIAQVVLK
jgi:hypothetical protein